MEEMQPLLLMEGSLLACVRLTMSPHPTEGKREGAGGDAALDGAVGDEQEVAMEGRGRKDGRGPRPWPEAKGDFCFINRARTLGSQWPRYPLLSVLAHDRLRGSVVQPLGTRALGLGFQLYCLLTV